MVNLKYVAHCIIPYTGRENILVWMEQAILEVVNETMGNLISKIFLSWSRNAFYLWVTTTR